jgi:hypothetical protein
MSEAHCRLTSFACGCCGFWCHGWRGSHSEPLISTRCFLFYSALEVLGASSILRFVVPACLIVTTRLIIARLKHDIPWTETT